MDWLLFAAVIITQWVIYRRKWPRVVQQPTDEVDKVLEMMRDQRLRIRGIEDDLSAVKNLLLAIKR